MKHSSLATPLRPSFRLTSNDIEKGANVKPQIVSTTRKLNDKKFVYLFLQSFNYFDHYEIKSVKIYNSIRVQSKSFVTNLKNQVNQQISITAQSLHLK